MASITEHVKNRTDLSIVLQIDYDLETRSNGEWVTFEAERLVGNLTHQTRQLPVSEDLEGRPSV